MSDDSAWGAIILGAVLFGILGRTDTPPRNYELVTSGGTPYRLNTRTGEVVIVDKTNLDAPRISPPLHWWERLQLSSERVRWATIKFNKDQYTGNLYTRWTGDRWHYWLYISPIVQKPGNNADVFILIQDRYRMTLVSTKVFLNKMETGVDKDNKPMGLSYEGDMQATDRDVKDAAMWHLSWDGF